MRTTSPKLLKSIWEVFQAVSEDLKLLIRLLLKVRSKLPQLTSQAQNHQEVWTTMTSNAMKADTPTSTERMEELISPPLDRNRVVSQHVPETCLTLRHKSTLIETQISNTHSEEPESSPRRMLEIILLIMVKRREEMPSPRLGMSHGTVEILPRHHAVAQVPSILVPPMPMTLVID